MINVFIDNFIHSNPKRAEEIDFCIERNKKDHNINYVLINHSSRMTYQDIINHINEYTSNDDINVISNIDIYFDDTILKLNKISNNEFIAITRREVKSDLSSYFKEEHAKHSQDVWAWRGLCKISKCDFYLGVLGCDNRLAYEAGQAGYDLINPAYSINVYHYHFVNVRGDEYYNKAVGKHLKIFPQSW